MDIIAVIPAYNESHTIASVVRYMLLHVDQVIVVDDSSSDRTGELAAKAGAVVLFNYQNQGYEYTLNKGLKEALDLGAKIIISCDGDGQHSIPAVSELIACVRDHNFHVAIGSRAVLPRFSERVFSTLTYFRFNTRDILSGLKCYSDYALRASGISSPWNSIGSYITLFCLKRGFNVANIPIAVNERMGESRFGSSMRQEFVIFKSLIISILRGF